VAPPPIPPELSFVERALKAVGAAFASARREQSLDKDLFDGLSEAEEQVLSRHWPKAKPSGSGASLYDDVVQIRVRRLRWRSRLKTAREIVWMAMVVIICAAATWHQFLQ